MIHFECGSDGIAPCPCRCPMGEPVIVIMVSRRKRGGEKGAMTKPKPKPRRAVDAVRAAIEREREKRADDIKPIEIVKAAICGYQAYLATGALAQAAVESEDRAGLRRGTQAAVDRLLFNANYWRSAYEDRIVAACSRADDARECLNAVAVWNKHTLRLNTLRPDEVVETFERFCPPFALNNRRGSEDRMGAGKGPVSDFKACVLRVAQHEDPVRAEALAQIAADMEDEARLYDQVGATGSLDALYAVLPAWCLQDRIDLVRGGWWDDCDVMALIAESLYERFMHDGFGDAVCQYFLDSCREAIDGYQRYISTEPSAFADRSIAELVELVRTARRDHPDSETDGYGGALPAWLIGKEQLIWNIVVCAVFGPSSARPLLVESPALLSESDYTARTDVITELAQASFARYTADRADDREAAEFATFDDQPPDLRNSGIEHIRSIPAKLATLGYGIVPAGSCYPDQRVTSFTASEVECLAILEHRRWLRERSQAGWVLGPMKDVRAKTSPYLVPWEDLPDRAREWNRSAVRNIPALLATVGLAIAR